MTDEEIAEHNRKATDSLSGLTSAQFDKKRLKDLELKKKILSSEIRDLREKINLAERSSDRHKRKIIKFAEELTNIIDKY